MSFGNMFKQYRKAHKLSQKEIGKLIGVSDKTISAYEINNNFPSYQDFIKICNILKVSPEYFMSDDVPYSSSNLSDNELKLLKAYKSASKREQEIVDYTLSLSKIMPKEPLEKRPVYYFPILKQQAAAGTGRISIGDDFDIENIATDSIPKSAKFGMKIEGISMETEIPNGSTVLINPNVPETELEDKNVIARVHNEIICKKYVPQKDHIWFKSINRDSSQEDRRVYSKEEYSIIGEVVKVIFK